MLPFHVKSGRKPSPTCDVEVPAKSLLAPMAPKKCARSQDHGLPPRSPRRCVRSTRCVQRLLRCRRMRTWRPIRLSKSGYDDVHRNAGAGLLRAKAERADGSTGLPPKTCSQRRSRLTRSGLRSAGTRLPHARGAVIQRPHGGRKQRELRPDVCQHAPGALNNRRRSPHSAGEDGLRS